MTGDVSGEWPHAQVGPWLIALALSCTVHGALVWEGLTLPLPKRQWVENVLPVEVVNPPPEPERPSPPPPKPRPMVPPRPVVPPKPVTSVPQPVPEPPRPKLEEPARETPPIAAPPAPAEAASAVALAPLPSPSIESAPREPVQAPAPPAPAPAPPVAAVTPSAPAAPRFTQPARPRGGYQVRPAYPAAARQAGAQGTTLLRVHVRADGAVDQVQVSRSAGYVALDDAAAAAVARWRFEPARNGSDPVAVWVLIPVEFRIQSEN